MSDASKPFVETVRIQNFGCARDVTLELTRLHALIGPNDSGKSTVLHAIHTMSELLRLGEHALREHLDPRGIVGAEVTMGWSDIEIACTRKPRGWLLQIGGRPEPSYASPISPPFMAEIARPAQGARLVRWDPDAIRQPCELIPEGRVLAIGERGEGLPAIYDAVLSRDRYAFDEIDAEVRRHFPTIKGIWLPILSGSKKGLGAILNDETRVHANELSEGLLYWLAFAALPHIECRSILLIEEPENGLHPTRIAEVMKMLRRVSERTQVILATHSPLVINELQPDEVTILTRDSKTGTRATRLDRTKHFQQRQQVYALGELWLSFADGVEEAALVNDSTTKPPAG